MQAAYDNVKVEESMLLKNEPVEEHKQETVTDLVQDETGPICNLGSQTGREAEPSQQLKDVTKSLQFSGAEQEQTSLAPEQPVTFS